MMAHARRSTLVGVATILILFVVTGCGESTSTTSTQSTSTATGHDQSPSGDIPDTATFLMYRSTHYTLQYVEGWVQQGLANDGVQFTDKDSFVRVILQPPSSSATQFAAVSGMAQTAQEFPQLTGAKVTSVALPAGNAALIAFQTQSVPDPVTSKTVSLTVDRYYIPGPHFMAVLTQATPLGVDNVDAFLQIAKSFGWSGQ
jgi:hypothetical protein